MAEQFKFSEKRIEDLPTAIGVATWYADTATPGLALTVSPLGKKVYYAVIRSGGRSRRIKIGRADRTSLLQARNAVKRYSGEAAQGKAVHERVRAGSVTVDDVFGEWLESYAKLRKKTWERDQQDYGSMLRPLIGGKLVTSVIPHTVESALAKVEHDHGKPAAFRAHTVLSGIFRQAVRAKHIEHNPVREVKRVAFEPRDRYLKPGEVAAFMAAVDSLRSKTARDFILLALHTGQRRDNVGSMRWDELDGNTWRIPVTKAKQKKPVVVHLTAGALEIIKARRNNGSPYVLPADRSTGDYYKDPKQAWRIVLKRAGISGLRVHDLRRSLGFYLGRAGQSLKTIQLALGHSDIGTTSKFYAPMAQSQVGAAVDGALDAIMRAGK